MGKRLWGALCLLSVASCGGSTRDGTQEDQATSATESSATCEDLQADAVALINTAVASAPKTCSADNDCLMVLEGADCVFSCGLNVAVTDATGIRNAVATVKTDFCPDECRDAPPPCGGSEVIDPTPRCVAGVCTIMSGE